MATAGGLTMLGAPALAKGPKPFFKRVGLPIGLQLYTLGDLPEKDLEGTLKKVAAIGYRDIQLPGLFGKTPQEIRATADKFGLKITSLHIPAAALGPNTAITLASPPVEIAATMKALGAKNIAMPIMLLPAEFRPGPNESFKDAIVRALAAEGAGIWKRTAAFLNEKALALKPFGLHLGYHNHNMEFAPVGQTTGWDILVNETKADLVSFEVDVGWVTAAGLDPVEFLNRHKGRVRQLHVKDVMASTKANFGLTMDPTQIGAGKQDWAKLLPAAYKAGVRNFYVEQEPPFAISRMEAIAQSYTYLAALKA
jgi:sugar phosphate isomerase/epimerase